MSDQHTVDVDPAHSLILRDVSKFYGDILGVNRVDLVIEPGITSLVGPNGSGKSTLMNLMSGLIRPSRGSITMLGLEPQNTEAMFRILGYCTQYDSFPHGLSGRQFLRSYLRVHGYQGREANRLTDRALERVSLTDAADRRVGGYSKGMRQRIKLAQAIAHQPKVMILDEPLNGLDPVARAEAMALFRELAEEGMHVLISSHILHEVDMLSDRVIMMNSGYIIAEGQIQGVRGEMEKHPMQVMVRCDRPSLLASRVFSEDHVVEVKMHEDAGGLLVRTRDADRFFEMMNRIVLADSFLIESIAPADDNVHAVYQYLMGGGGEVAS